MPTYEYLCEKCGSTTEECHSIKDIPNETKCGCGGNAKKQISKVNWILKGAGDNWPSQQLRRKNQMTKNNEDAGNRGREEWRKRMPKLVYR